MVILKIHKGVGVMLTSSFWDNKKDRRFACLIDQELFFQ